MNDFLQYFQLQSNAAMVTIGIIIAAIIGLFFSLKRLRLGQERRHDRIFDRLEWRSAVSTESPLDHPRTEARKTATQSLEMRFSIIRRLVVLLFILVVLLAGSLPFLGAIPKTFISVLVAAVSVLVGIAAKPFLENFIAGIVLTFGKPFRVGDTVIIDDKHYGTVEDITMTYTIIKLWDWRRFVVPNAQMMSKEFLNLTLKDSYIWSYVEFWIAPDTDIDVVQNVAIEAANSSAAFAGHEPPGFWVMGMEEKAMRCWVAGWVDSPADAWQFCSDIRVALIRQFKVLKVSPHKMSVDINGVNNVDIPDQLKQGFTSPPRA